MSCITRPRWQPLWIERIVWTSLSVVLLSVMLVCLVALVEGLAHLDGVDSAPPISAHASTWPEPEPGDVCEDPGFRP